MDLLAALIDPAVAGWAGQAVALLSILGALVVALRWWFQNRNR